jgi:ssDNA-binding Zn-finger/Zn-ribbon topoisomerase 1
MAPHPRIRKAVKWLGLFIFAFSLAALFITQWWAIRFCPASQKVMVLCTGGAAQLWYIHAAPWSLGDGFASSPAASQWIAAPYVYRSPIFFYAIIPFWLPALLAIIPTILIWFFDHVAIRRAVLASGQCPDCRAAITTPAPITSCPSCGAHPTWGHATFPRTRRAFMYVGAPLALLFLLAWTTSRFQTISFVDAPAIREVRISSLGLQYSHTRLGRFGSPRGWNFELPPTPAPWLNRPFFENTSGYTIVLIPHWLSTLPLLITSATAWLLHPFATRRERARQLSHCPKCNYSRAGLPENAPCPECGARAPTPKRRK